MLSSTEVKKIAHLARLGIEEQKPEEKEEDRVPNTTIGETNLDPHPSE